MILYLGLKVKIFLVKRYGFHTTLIGPTPISPLTLSFMQGLWTIPHYLWTGPHCLWTIPHLK